MRPCFCQEARYRRRRRLVEDALRVLAPFRRGPCRGRDAAQGSGRVREPGAAGSVVEDVDRLVRDLGVDVPQGIQQLQQRAFVLELVEFGELSEFGNVHLSVALN